MIAQSSNNRPSGSTAKQCDAGIPVVGRTSATGEYQILKVNPDGSLAGIGNVPLDNANCPFIDSMAASGTPGGAIPPNSIIAYQPVIANPITEGMYRINPVLFYDGTPTGSVNFTLVKIGSTLDAYINTRVPFVDSFAPIITDLISGLGGFWHNVSIQTFGTNIQTAYNRNNALTTFLTAGSYALLITVDGAITQNAGGQFFGFYEFSKVS